METLVDVVAHCAAISTDWDYQPVLGNLGDALIAAGTFSAFAEAGVTLHTENRHPDSLERPVLVAGCGNLVRYYDNMARVLGLLQASPSERIVVLPQTIEGHEDLLASLGPRFEIFCRDRVSYAHVRSLHTGSVHRDHDMATHIDPEALFTAYATLAPESKPPALRAIERVMTQAADHSRRNRRHGRLFRADVESLGLHNDGDNLDLSWLCVDVWRIPDVVTIMAGAFLRALSMYDEIATDRLHVAIGGGLLGIPVRLYPNSYHKNAAVYEMTMARYPSVTMAVEIPASTDT